MEIPARAPFKNQIVQMMEFSLWTEGSAPDKKKTAILVFLLVTVKEEIFVGEKVRISFKKPVVWTLSQFVLSEWPKKTKNPVISLPCSQCSGDWSFPRNWQLHKSKQLCQSRVTKKNTKISKRSNGLRSPRKQFLVRNLNWYFLSLRN